MYICDVDNFFATYDYCFSNIYYICQIMSSQILSKMLFAEKIRQLREEKQLLQRQVSAALEIDNALYCKIERGDRSAKREQVIALAQLFAIDSDVLLSLWLADKLIVTIGNEDELAQKALNIVQEQIKRK